MGQDDIAESAPQRQRWTFGEFVVDEGRRTLERAGAPVSVEPQVFDVLVHLIRNRYRVVGKLELLDTVWGDRFVSPATLTSRIRDLRAAVGDTGRDQRVIKTAHGRGFQFVAEATDDVGAVRSHNKPIYGRERERAAIGSLLETGRMVTLVGAAGIGKTHLLKHVLPSEDAVIVELADLSSGDAVPRAVLSAVGGTEEVDLDPTAAVVRFLEPSSLTLAIDNCEHVIDATRELISALVNGCPGLRIVATSRRPLLLEAETVLRLEPLRAEAAVELLVNHARRHGVALKSDDPLVASLCQRLDGLPLALELAASKSRALPLAELVQLLDRGLSVLTTDVVDGADHHRSLAAAIQWSVELLSESQRKLLAGLSVFPGSITVAGARAVGGDRPDLLSDLVELRDVSLLEFESATSTYRLLESIKAFATDQRTGPDAERAHTDFTVASIEDAATIETASLVAHLTAIADRWPDIRATIYRAFSADDITTIHQVVASLIRYGDQTLSLELLSWTESAIAADRSAGHQSPPSTLVCAAILCAHAGKFDEGWKHLHAVRDLDVEMLVVARLWLSYFTGDMGGADAATDATRQYPAEPLAYERAMGAIVGNYLDIFAGRPVDDHNLRILGQMADSDDDALRAGSELCAALRLNWEDDGDRAVEMLNGVISVARRNGLALLASGASQVLSLVLATVPDAVESARGLRSALRGYVDTASWQFALADFAPAALILASHGQEVLATELLAVRDAGGYVGDASRDVATTAAAMVASKLTPDEIAIATTQASGRSVRVASLQAIDALATIADDH